MSAAELRQIVVPIGSLHRNPWNPNKQSARVYQAEKESITEYGFIDPITVRPHPTIEGEWEIIDGEHRWKAATELEIAEVPIIVLEGLTEAQTKKLTIILNETTGEADVALLGKLVAALREEMDAADLKLGLPYSDNELQHLTEVGSYDWDDFGSDGGDLKEPPAPEEAHSFVLVFGSKRDLEKFHTLATIVDHERQTGGETAAVLAALTETVSRIEESELDPGPSRSY